MQSVGQPAAPQQLQWHARHHRQGSHPRAQSPLTHRDVAQAAGAVDGVAAVPGQVGGAVAGVGHGHSVVALQGNCLGKAVELLCHAVLEYVGGAAAGVGGGSRGGGAAKCNVARRTGGGARMEAGQKPRGQAGAAACTAVSAAPTVPCLHPAACKRVGWRARTDVVDPSAQFPGAGHGHIAVSVDPAAGSGGRGGGLQSSWAQGA